MAVRRLLHAMGYRFTVNGPRNKKLPGKPDIVLPRRRCVIFVHGCFWHLHEGCREGRKPGSNRDYWSPKLDKNKQRDQRNQRLLRKLGWRVFVVWECQLKRPEKVARRLDWLLKSG